MHKTEGSKQGKLWGKEESGKNKDIKRKETRKEVNNGKANYFNPFANTIKMRGLVCLLHLLFLGGIPGKS